MLSQHLTKEHLVTRDLRAVRSVHIREEYHLYNLREEKAYKSYIKSIYPRHGFIKIQISYKVKETINKIRRHQLEGYISNVKMKGCCLEYLPPSTYLCKKKDNWLEKPTKETM